MAEARPTLQINDCTICFEEMSPSMVLPCQHNFCRSCVQQLTSNDVIKCPHCNHVHAASDVRPDFRLQQFLDVLNEGKGTDVEKEEEADRRSLCELCEDNRFSVWCVQCEQWMCGACKTTHSKAKVSRDHDFKSEKDVCEGLQEELAANYQTFKTATTPLHAQVSAESLKASLAELQENKRQCLMTIGLYRKNAEEAVQKFFDGFRDRVMSCIEADQKVLQDKLPVLEQFSGDLKFIENALNGEANDNGSLYVSCTDALGLMIDWIHRSGKKEICEFKVETKQFKVEKRAISQKAWRAPSKAFYVSKRQMETCFLKKSHTLQQLQRSRN